MSESMRAPWQLICSSGECGLIAEAAAVTVNVPTACSSNHGKDAKMSNTAAANAIRRSSTRLETTGCHSRPLRQPSHPRTTSPPTEAGRTWPKNNPAKFRRTANANGMFAPDLRASNAHRIAARGTEAVTKITARIKGPKLADSSRVRMAAHSSLATRNPINASVTSALKATKRVPPDRPVSTDGAGETDVMNNRPEF